jgi:hypothetical protein
LPQLLEVCVLGQTTLQYAQKGYRGRAKPVNRKNGLHKLRIFLQPRCRRSNALLAALQPE